MYRALGVALVSLELVSTTGCVSQNGQPDNTATGALAGGLIGALAGGLAGGRHGGRDALIGGLAGVIAGGLIGHMIDEQQRERLQAQSPQTLQTIQHNDAVYQQQQQAASTPDAAPAEKPVPLTVDDIKALDSAGVKKDAIVAEIQRSKAVYSDADIAALQQSNPNIDPAVIEAMRKSATSS